MVFNFNAAEVFQVAVQIEENGRRFYQEGLKQIDDPEVKRLFEELAREEVEHRKKFESLLAELPKEAFSPTVFDPEDQKNQYIQMMADQHVFVQAEGMGRLLAGLGSMQDALKLAIEFEKDSVIFFLSMQDATEGKRGKELINLLIKEEQEHLRRLSASLHRVTRK